MIGIGLGLGVSRPAYGPPPLDINFLYPVLDPRITFTRGSAGTRINALGQIESVGNNLPRFDYDPVSLQPKGLLVEEQRTNLLTWTEDFTNAAWTGAASRTLSMETLNGSPFYTIAKTLTNPNEFCAQLAGDHPVGVYTATFALLSGTVGSSGLGINHSVSGWGTNGNATATVLSGPGSVTQNNGAWWTVTGLSATVPTVVGLTVTTVEVGALRYILYPGTAASTTVGHSVKAARPQLEAGTFPTSYIPTTTAAVTRAADNAIIDGERFSRWFNPLEGTFVLEADSVVPTSTSAYNIARIDNGAGTDWHRLLIYNSHVGVNVRSANLEQAEILKTGHTPKTPFKMAYAWGGGSMSIAKDGGAASSAAIANLPINPSRLVIGGPANYLNGHIRRLRYWPRRLSNAQLQELTL